MVDINIIASDPELCEVVYSAEVADQKFQQQLKELSKTQEAQGERLANLEGRKAVPKPENWFKRNSYWISPVVASVGLVLGTGFLMRYFTLTVDSEISSKLHDPITDISDLKRDVAVIRKSQDDTQALLRIVIANDSKRISAMSQRDFQDRLPEVRAVLNAAKSTRTEVAPVAFGEIRSKLEQSNRSEPEFWPTAASLINYVSATPAPTVELADCLNSPPILVGVNTTAGSKIVTHGPNVYSNCKIDLDDPRASVVFGHSLSLADLEFRRSLIVYRGRPIIIQLGAPPLNHLVGKFVFIDCVFNIQSPSNPSLSGKKLIESLLAAQDLHSVRIAVPNEG